MILRSKIVRPLNKWFCFGAIICIYFLCYLHNRTIRNEKFRSINNTIQIAPKNAIDSVGDSDISSDTRDPLYYVHSAKCRIPYVDPFAPEILDVYKPMTFEPCSNESDLVTPVYDINRQRYILHINESLAIQLLNSSDTEYYCYYQEVTRNAKRDSYNELLPRVYFSQNLVVPLHVQYLILACHTANKSHVLQSDAYSFVQHAAQPKVTASPSAPRKPSVIMFGIDSISRINLRRTMPKVYNFLTRSGWYEMQGYNKIADNTFPNLMAVLSGYLPDTVKANVCDTNEDGCLDRLPFIWKYFRNASYLTAYAEDESGINTFNYVKPGFVQQPTDYYLRPFVLAIEDNFRCARCTMTYCIGRRITSSYIYDFCKQFAQRYINERPIWGLFWANSFSHDDYAMPSKLERNILQYLLDFERDGIFRESIFIFFADHGARYGTLSYFSSGFLEERLPMLFISLPAWFRAEYPQYARALSMNRNRLTSNYDLHNTLKHIIELGGTPDGPQLPQANDCPKCKSLFYPMDEERNCADAAIPEHFCTCEPFKRLTSKWAMDITPLVIERMNQYLASKNLTSLCSKLSLSYIHQTEMKLGLDKNWHGDHTMDEGIYRVMFKVQQNSADFTATLKFNNITKNIDLDVETISRLNSYKDDATCLEDKLAKLYCICLDKLRKD